MQLWTKTEKTSFLNSTRTQFIAQNKVRKANDKSRSYFYYEPGRNSPTREVSSKMAATSLVIDRWLNEDGANTHAMSTLMGIISKAGGKIQQTHTDFADVIVSKDIKYYPYSMILAFMKGNINIIIRFFNKVGNSNLFYHLSSQDHRCRFTIQRVAQISSLI